jgi:SnoaL-like domain
VSVPNSAARGRAAPDIGEPRPFLGYDSEQAALFAAAWLPAWSRNNPRRLASFYTRDTFYCDPQVPRGIRGREALTVYLERLLARYPDWVWTQTASTPMRDGFVNYWQAFIPLGRGELMLAGVCLVELRGGLIARNHVFFDRSALLDAIREQASRGTTSPHGNDSARATRPRRQPVVGHGPRGAR